MWKTATTCFLRTATECVTALLRLGQCAFFIQRVVDKGSFRECSLATSDARVEAIWRQIIEGFRGGILADWYVGIKRHQFYFLTGILGDHSSLAETFSLEEQEAEENFDLALISSLEIDLVPHLGGPRVPDYLVGQLAKILHKGSQLYRLDAFRSGSPSFGDWNKVGSSPNSREEFEKLDLESMGSTATGEVVPRERFSYWCFDLLFLICSDMTRGAYSR